MIFIQQICSSCGGAGERIADPCTSCRGTGTTTTRSTTKVTLPAGVNDGDTVRVPRKGSVGERGGPAGDLFVTIKVQPHEYFQRQNNDIFLEVPISFSQAIFGSAIKVPTIDNKILEVVVCKCFFFHY
jgi:molecular chaperone DnaJ